MSYRFMMQIYEQMRGKAPALLNIKYVKKERDLFTPKLTPNIPK